MAGPISESTTAYDGRVINGRRAEGSDQPSGFVYDGGLITAAELSQRTWGTVEASDGLIAPGLVTRIDGTTADELSWGGKGVTTVALQVGRAGSLAGNLAADGVLDLVLIAGIDQETTEAGISEAIAQGIGVFNASVHRTPADVHSLTGRTVLVDSANAGLPDWAREAAREDFTLVITAVDAGTLPACRNIKLHTDARVFLEVTTDDLAAQDQSLWAAVLDGTMDICAMPGPGSPSAPKLLLDAVANRKLPVSRFAELTSTAPALALGIQRRKGTLDAGKDADAAVIDARTPGVDIDPNQHGRVSAVLRRGDFLFLQQQIHAKPASGTVLPSETRMRRHA